MGKTLKLLLAPMRDGEAAKRFFIKTLATSYTMKPGVINVDKKAVYSKAFIELKTGRIHTQAYKLRQVEYLNILVEQDHCFLE